MSGARPGQRAVSSVLSGDSSRNGASPTEDSEIQLGSTSAEGAIGPSKRSTIASPAAKPVEPGPGLAYTTWGPRSSCGSGGVGPLIGGGLPPKSIRYASVVVLPAASTISTSKPTREALSQRTSKRLRRVVAVGVSSAPGVSVTSSSETATPGTSDCTEVGVTAMVGCDASSVAVMRSVAVAETAGRSGACDAYANGGARSKLPPP